MNGTRRRARAFLDLNVNLARRFPLDTFIAVESEDLSAEQILDKLESFFREMPVPMIETANGFTYAVGGRSTDDGSIFFIRSLAYLTNAVWAGKDTEWECPVYEACELAIKDGVCRIRPWEKGRSRRLAAWGLRRSISPLPGDRFGSWADLNPPYVPYAIPSQFCSITSNRSMQMAALANNKKVVAALPSWPSGYRRHASIPGFKEGRPSSGRRCSLFWRSEEVRAYRGPARQPTTVPVPVRL